MKSPAAFVAEALAHVDEFFLDELAAHVVVAEDELEVGYEFLDLAVVVLELVLLELREVAQTHVHDGLCLLVAEGEALHEGGFGLFGVGRGADDADYLVDVL